MFKLTFRNRAQPAVRQGPDQTVLPAAVGAQEQPLPGAVPHAGELTRDARGSE